ncbi:MAG: hypothetical protein OEY56_03955 [Cyclobacteriaceae bacterium]|nr:hypothetical protein [Cyclobacteriaceae bacterium]
MAIIKLKLVDNGGSKVLYWSSDGVSWGIVDGQFPSTGVNRGDTIEWQADDTINNVTIHFQGGGIIANGSINGNGSKSPNAQVPSNCPEPQQDKYTIRAIPAGGGAPVEVDPDIVIPPK